MRFEACIALLLTSLVVFASCSSDDDGNNRRILVGHDKLWHLDHREDKKNSTENATEQRPKRSISSSERTTVLYNFNYQRGLVGASDMNYLSYATGLETDLSNWTRRCNFNDRIYSTYEGDVIKAVYTGGYPDHTTGIQTLFSETDTRIFYGVRSKYVAGVAGSVDYCSVLTANGRIYYGAYLRVYGLLSSSVLFDATVRQYTPGRACTQCQSNVGWCYNNKLCRDDCSLSIYGCCQISNGVPTSVCNGAPGIRVTGIAILFGVLLSICYYLK